MLYRHPHKRGFLIEVSREGFLSVCILFWNYELRWNKHCSPPSIDLVRDEWERKISNAENRAQLAESSLSDTRTELETKVDKLESDLAEAHRILDR